MISWQSAPQSGPVGRSWITVSGSNIVSIGVKTQGIQGQFQIVQLYVLANGAQAFAQVENTSSSPTTWWACTLSDNDPSETVEFKEESGQEESGQSANS